MILLMIAWTVLLTSLCIVLRWRRLPVYDPRPVGRGKKSRQFNSLPENAAGLWALVMALGS